jgi:hypothetical protein
MCRHMGLLGVGRWHTRGPLHYHAPGSACPVVPAYPPQWCLQPLPTSSIFNSGGGAGGLGLCGVCYLQTDLQTLDAQFQSSSLSCSSHNLPTSVRALYGAFLAQAALILLNTPIVHQKLCARQLASCFGQSDKEMWSHG